jgi:hypothetical protein
MCSAAICNGQVKKIFLLPTGPFSAHADRLHIEPKLFSVANAPVIDRRLLPLSCGFCPDRADRFCKRRCEALPRPAKASRLFRQETDVMALNIRLIWECTAYLVAVTMIVYALNLVGSGRP